MFRWGEFTSSAGLTLPFKIELDELNDTDWDCLARMVAAEFSFCAVEGVATGGLRFAESLRLYADTASKSAPLLIVDDVLTTGRSMERQRAGRDAMGVVVFARTRPVPIWIEPIFRLGPFWRERDG